METTNALDVTRQAIRYLDGRPLEIIHGSKLIAKPREYGVCWLHGRYSCSKDVHTADCFSCPLRIVSPKRKRVTIDELEYAKVKRAFLRAKKLRNRKVKPLADIIDIQKLLNKAVLSVVFGQLKRFKAVRNMTLDRESIYSKSDLTNDAYYIGRRLELEAINLDTETGKRQAARFVYSLWYAVALGLGLKKRGKWLSLENRIDEDKLNRQAYPERYAKTPKKVNTIS